MILKEESKCPFQANHKGQPTKEQNLWKKEKSESYSGFISSVTNFYLENYLPLRFYVKSKLANL